MRDGSIIARGKGNSDWNYSAPHGAGRVMSRAEARKKVDYNNFKQTMRNVYSTTVTPKTVDEAPFVYKPMQEIIKNIKDSVNVEKIITPIYNFKSQK